MCVCLDKRDPVRDADQHESANQHTDRREEPELLGQGHWVWDWIYNLQLGRRAGADPTEE